MFELERPVVPTTTGESFPVRRIFCIGKNYADHVAEMGGDPAETPPVFFTKPADAASSAAAIPFPPATENLHYEGELVVALKGGGRDLAEEDVPALIYGYACGCDLTRRDLQDEAKERGGPWDLAKALDNGAMLGPVTPRSDLLNEGPLTLLLNGETKQSADLSQMIWTIPAMISRLSRYFRLEAGDLVFTGTPSGVGPAGAGDLIEVMIADLAPLRFSLEP